MKNKIIYFIGKFSKRIRMSQYTKDNFYRWGLIRFIEDNNKTLTEVVADKSVLTQDVLDNILNQFKK